MGINPLPYLTLFLITLGLVFVKSFQQRNVVYGNIALVAPTSCVFAALEMLSIGLIAKAFITGESLLYTWAALAAGGAIGAISAVQIHRRYVR